MPPQQANWVAWRASCASRVPAPPAPLASSRVTITLPRQNAGAGGTGSRYPVPTNSRSALRATRARPSAATASPAAVDPLARLIRARRLARTRSVLVRGVLPVPPGGVRLGRYPGRDRRAGRGRHRQAQLLLAVLAVRVGRRQVVVAERGREA